MTVYDQFHDGSLDGLLIEDNNVCVFVSTYEGRRQVLVAEGVVALAAGGFRVGNVILDAQTQESGEVSFQDIQEVYGYRPGRDDLHVGNSLQKSQREELVLLSVNPSYGGSVLALARSVDVLDRQVWARRYLDAAAK